MLACAVRELIEETGYRAAEWARAGILHNAIAYSDRGHRDLVRARPARPASAQLDAGEFLDVLEASADELEAAARARRADRRQDPDRPALAAELARRPVAAAVAAGAA